MEKGAIAFYGLPYGEAGRFQAPRPAAAWPKGVGRERVACPQTPGTTARLGGYIPPQREDCLVAKSLPPFSETSRPCPFFPSFSAPRPGKRPRPWASACAATG
ncbi:hypothetical protein [Thermus sp.]|uniref:hypothetical protein n=1 Tax=Thermus sp. TaxID=275 RepID=UPI00391B1C31